MQNIPSVWSLHLLLSIIFVLVRNGSSSDCSDEKTCTQCVNKKSWSGNVCRWCPLDRKCHAHGAILTNPCTTKQNIVKENNCPVESYGVYNRRLSYHQVLLSSVAYSDEPARCMEKIKEKHNDDALDYEVVYVIGRQCDDFIFDYKECLAVIAISHKYKSILLSYRGSSGGKQVLDIALQSLFNAKVSFAGRGHVQTYFMNAFEKLYPCVKIRIQELNDKYPGYDTWVSGHSLGGALASIASAKLILDGIIEKDKMSLYTYGMPRVGDKNFAFEHDRIVNNSWRIVHYKDCVTHVPTCDPKALLSCTLEGGKGPYHHRTEVYYPESAMAPDSNNFIICHSNEDSRCSAKKFGVLQIATKFIDLPDDCLDSHKIYFNLRVGSYCQQLLGKRKKRSSHSSMHNLLQKEKCTVLEKYDNGDFGKAKVSAVLSHSGCPLLPSAKQTLLISILLAILFECLQWL